VELFSVELFSVELFSVELFSVELFSVELFSVELFSVELLSVELFSVELPSVELSVELVSLGELPLPNPVVELLLLRTMMGGLKIGTGKLKLHWGQIILTSFSTLLMM